MDLSESIRDKIEEGLTQGSPDLPRMREDGKREDGAIAYPELTDYPKPSLDPRKPCKRMDELEARNAKGSGLPKPLRGFVRDEANMNRLILKTFEEFIKVNEKVYKELDRLNRRVAKVNKKLEWLEEILDETRQDSEENRQDQDELGLELEALRKSVEKLSAAANPS